MGVDWRHYRYDHRKRAALQSTSYRWIDQGHFYLSPLRIFVLLHFNLHGDLVKDRDGDVSILRRRDGQRVVVGVIFRFSFEDDDTFDSESTGGPDPSDRAGLIFVWGATRTLRQTPRDHS